MTIITWGLRLVLFVLLVLFALQNSAPISLHWFPGQVWEGPLVLVLLVFFAAGVLLGVLSLLGLVNRQRRELAACRRGRVKGADISNVEPPAL
ncbi:LapA family protein [Azonexus sp. IMCC34839]|uniref:LapA family protein n=1 Tax=Azonexus sp. IMCC34839 TaxID=3133695 RepID=UPI00399AA39E